MIKSLIIVSFISILFVNCSDSSQQNISEEIKVEISVSAKSFMETLKSVLVEKIQNEGIVSAVSVCADTAQMLTDNFGKQKNIKIKRVSFKNRNPLNIPDDFETKVLKYFEELHQKNQLKPNTEYFELVEENGIKKVRYLRPIFVQAECLNCHGTEELILPDVRNVIDTKYKNDKAKNYKVDDLRGAVSIEKELL